MSNFQPLEVVDRASETQPQVVENARVINKYYKLQRSTGSAQQRQTAFSNITVGCLCTCKIHFRLQRNDQQLKGLNTPPCNGKQQ